MTTKPRVLMVDVADTIAGDLRHDLAALGCECEVVHGVDSAVARASGCPTAVVLVGDADEGPELAEALSQLGNTTPVVGVGADVPTDAIAHLAQGRSSTPVPVCARPTRVLVVDDDEDLRWLLDFELKDAGFEVTLAKDGEEALDQLHGQAPPDVVVVDIMMPHMSGQQLLQRLSRMDPPPRAIVYSSFAIEADAIHPCVEAVMRKPTRTAELVAALRAATS